MPMAREMQRLRDEHAALITLARILTGMIRAPQPPRMTELTAARGLLRDTLLRHLKCEDWILYPRLKASGDPDLIRITREFELEMGDLAADFAVYDEKWTAGRVTAAWPDFCRETAIILEMLGMRVEREERDLYPLAESLRPSRVAMGIAAVGA